MLSQTKITCKKRGLRKKKKKINGMKKCGKCVVYKSVNKGNEVKAADDHFLRKRERKQILCWYQ